MLQSDCIRWRAWPFSDVMLGHCFFVGNLDSENIFQEIMFKPPTENGTVLWFLVLKFSWHEPATKGVVKRIYETRCRVGFLSAHFENGNPTPNHWNKKLSCHGWRDHAMLYVVNREKDACRRGKKPQRYHFTDMIPGEIFHDGQTWAVSVYFHISSE